MHVVQNELWISYNKLNKTSTSRKPIFIEYGIKKKIAAYFK